MQALETETARTIPMPTNPKVLEAWVLDAMKRATTDAVLSCAHMRGRGDKNGADECAVAGMGGTLNQYLPVCAEVVIGEGKWDKAPMLEVGKQLGPVTPVMVKLAVDPIDGTRPVAQRMSSGGIAVIAGAMVGEGDLFGCEYEGYMEKFVIGSQTKKAWFKALEKQVVPEQAKGFNPALSPFEQDLEPVVRFIAYANQKDPDELVACMLERPRNDHYLNRLREDPLKVQCKLAQDGDVALAFNVQDPEMEADFALGSGGSPEAVIAAAGIKVSGGYGWFKWFWETDSEAEEGRKALLAEGKDPNQIYTVDDLAPGHVMIAYSAITDTDRLKGYRLVNGFPQVETYYGRSRSGTDGIQRTRHTDPPRRLER